MSSDRLQSQITETVFLDSLTQKFPLVVQWLNSQVNSTGLVCLIDPQFFFFLMSIFMHEHGPVVSFAKLKDQSIKFPHPWLEKSKIKYNMYTFIVYQFLIINAMVTGVSFNAPISNYIFVYQHTLKLIYLVMMRT